MQCGLTPASDQYAPYAAMAGKSAQAGTCHLQALAFAGQQGILVPVVQACGTAPISGQTSL